jgi:hypothetical protein
VSEESLGSFTPTEAPFTFHPGSVSQAGKLVACESNPTYTVDSCDSVKERRAEDVLPLSFIAVLIIGEKVKNAGIAVVL